MNFFSLCLFTHRGPWLSTRNDRGELVEECWSCHQRKPKPVLQGEMLRTGPQQIQAPVLGQPTGRAMIERENVTPMRKRQR